MNTKNRSGVVSAFIAAVCSFLMLVQPAQASPLTQTIGGLSSTTCCWTYNNMGSIALTNPTNSVSSLTTNMDIVDQGWGGMDPASNQVRVELSVNGTTLWSDHVAGAYHWWTNQSYAADAGDLVAINGVIAGLNWLTNPTVAFSLWTYGLGYPGWELHVANATMSVTSDVPEPASLALLGLGLAGLAFARRRKQAA